MNILVVAPENADLPNAASEIAAIQRYHHAIVLDGPVRDRDIELAVEEGPFDVIWWISHGSKAGVLLTDGLLSIGGVGQYVAASRAQLCVLNTCDSEDVALAIAAGGKADVICTIGLVANADAIRLGSLLAGELANTDNYKAAHDIVAPRGGPYRYIRANAQYRRRNDEQEVTLKDIMNVLAGDKKFGSSPGLVTRVEKVEGRLGQVDGRLGQVENRLGDVEGHLSDVQSDVVELKQLIHERFERGRITVTPEIAWFFLGLLIFLFVLVGYLFYVKSSGAVDGQLGLAIRIWLYS